MIRRTYIPIVDALVDMPKPVVAAINGPAAGAGLSIALACDLRYMADDAVLMLAFSNIGLVPDCGGTWLLVRAVGHARAFELAATGRRVHADEALALGLVQRVLPATRCYLRLTRSPASSRRVRRSHSAGPSACCALPSGARWPT